LIIIFGWVLGIERGLEEAHKGSRMRIPRVFTIIFKYLAPLYLLTIFAFWVLFNVFGWQPGSGEFKPTSYVTDLIGSEPNQVARLSVGVIVICVGFFLILIAAAGKRWTKRDQITEGEEI